MSPSLIMRVTCHSPSSVGLFFQKENACEKKLFLQRLPLLLKSNRPCNICLCALMACTHAYRAVSFSHSGLIQNYVASFIRQRLIIVSVLRQALSGTALLRYMVTGLSSGWTELPHCKATVVADRSPARI